MKVLLACFALIGLAAYGQGASRFDPTSRWDASLLDSTIHAIDIKGDSLFSAWRCLSVNYLLRCNLYCERELGSGGGPFTLHVPKATGKQILEALIAAYPDFTYSQDSKTGVIWIYPRKARYNDILDLRLSVEEDIVQIPFASEEAR